MQIGVSFGSLITLIGLISFPTAQSNQLRCIGHEYTIDVTLDVPSGSAGCSDQQMYEIGVVIEDTMRKVFEHESISADFFTSNILDPNGSHKGSRRLSNVDPEQAESGGASIRTRSLYGSFIYRGAGKCIGCNPDSSDQRRSLVELFPWEWFENLMEPKLSLECTNKLHHLYRNKKNHCLHNQETSVVFVLNQISS